MARLSLDCHFAVSERDLVRLRALVEASDDVLSALIRRIADGNMRLIDPERRTVSPVRVTGRRVMVHVRLSRNLVARLDRLADAMDSSRAALLRGLIRRAISENRPAVSEPPTGAPSTRTGPWR
jgi:hypothetical protein